MNKSYFREVISPDQASCTRSIAQTVCRLARPRVPRADPPLLCGYLKECRRGAAKRERACLLRDRAPTVYTELHSQVKWEEEFFSLLKKGLYTITLVSV